ncbi:MAG: 50S ribosomal protein L11 methyltransferase [Desulfomonile sp.]|nr:50S ribosomal protein L11 methyltransferase [Desulfomonile sp.]
MKRRRGSAAIGWEGLLRTIDVGKRLRIVPLWEKGRTNAARINLVIDPGPSFGAGDHPTTVMALELLEEAMALLQSEMNAPSMLDAGTGTGVLAIAAKALGSGLTVGLDIDGAAICVARRNAQLNGNLFLPCESGGSIHFFVGDASAVRGEFDVVAANLAAPVLVRSAKLLTKLTARYLVLSGIAEEMEAAVFAGFGSLEMNLMRKTRQDQWCAGLVERRGAKINFE